MGSGRISKKSAKTSRTMEGFYFVTAITGFSRHNTGKKDDEDDKHG
jgi:hypothetical protein